MTQGDRHAGDWYFNSPSQAMDSTLKIKNPNPKRTAHIFSKLVFGWMVQLCYKGNKQPLGIDDLYEALPEDKSQLLCDVLEKNWNRELEKAEKQKRKPSLLNVIRKTFFWSYGLNGLLICFQMTIARPLQPIMLAMFINLFSPEANSHQNQDKMYLYGGLIILASLVVVVIQHHCTLLLSQIGMRVRIACCSLIYRKMLRLSKTSINESAAGQIVNLLSNDVSRFDLVSTYLHTIWIMPIQVTLITYLVWEHADYAGLIGIATLVILLIPIHVCIGKYLSVLRLKVAEATDRRVQKMNELISGIQIIKMYTWEKPFAAVIRKYRANEINILTRAQYIKGAVAASAVFIERLALFVTVTSCVLLGNVISADKVFSMVQFFNQLQLSLAFLYPVALQRGAETLVTVERLRNFLMLGEKSLNEIKTKESKEVSVYEVNACWTPGLRVLGNINLKIPPRSLVAFVGAVGSGKSSFLHLLLGELSPETGTVEIGGSVSYASQEPWLFASTVRKNVLFGQHYNRDHYKKVIKVCALEKDLHLLPCGDKTMVGERGVSLSGGQKARINLARAVYRNADIYLLDDPLSAVDTHVGKHIFQECVLGFLEGKTRILVTHQLQYLKTADKIVVINDGKIEAEGTYSELLNNWQFEKLLAVANQNTEAKEGHKISRKASIVSTVSIESEILDRKSVTDDAEKVTKPSNKNVYWAYWRAGRSVPVLVALFLTFIIAQVVTNAVDLWTQQESMRNLTCSNPTKHISWRKMRYEEQDVFFYKAFPSENCDDMIPTNVAMYIYLVLILASTLLLLFTSVYFYKVAMSSSKNLHSNMFSRLLEAPMRFFDTNPSGRILNRFSRDMGMIDEILPFIKLIALQVLLAMTGILVMVCISNYFMIPIAIVLTGMFFIMRKWYASIARVVKHLEGITRSPVFSHLTASLNGISTIRASNAEEILKKEFDLHQDVHTSAWYTMLVCMSAFGLWLDFLSLLFIICVIYGFIILNQYGTVENSMVGLAVSYSLVLTGMVQFGMRQAVEVVCQMPSVERVLEYTGIEQEGPQETPKDKLPEKSWPQYGAVKFEDVYLQYSQTEPPVLRKISFNVHAGEKVGIVGRTGAGKSSLITALFRLAPVQGSIVIDDVDTQTLGLNDIRKKISIIPQDPVLFSATLRYNLDPFDEFSDDDIWKALEEVELKDVADSLDFVVQEGGVNLSAGQRQLLCLARAILRNNKILVLDEATANVDPRTDALIQKTIRSKFSTCTVFTIAHRLHTVMDCDKVLVMDAGRMVEYEHPHELLRNCNGHFYQMVEHTGSTMAADLHGLAAKAFEQKS